jgi:hypothetical protein
VVGDDLPHLISVFFTVVTKSKPNRKRREEKEGERERERERERETQKKKRKEKKRKRRERRYVTVPLVGWMRLVLVVGRMGLVLVVSGEAHFNCHSCYFVSLRAIHVYIRFKSTIVNVSDKYEDYFYNWRLSTLNRSRRPNTSNCLFQYRFHCSSISFPFSFHFHYKFLKQIRTL